MTPTPSDDIAARMTAEGWSIVPDDGFIAYVGPFWHRIEDNADVYAVATDARHKNRRGLVQGGLLMTFADRTLGMTARIASGAAAVATIQLDTHFIDAGRIGDLLISRPQVVRTTRTLIFLRTDITADGRVVSSSNAVFKTVRHS